MSRMTRRSVVRLYGAVSAAVLLAAGSAIRPTLEAQATSNLIVTENALAGSPQSEWDIQGSGDPTLQGFATDISVSTGSVVSFKIKTSAPGYLIDIYRLGYYQGFGARKIATVTPTAAQVTAAQNQPACLTDVASGLIDCGNWAVSGSWNTTGATSGIFIAKLSRSDNLNASSHIYFIVRDDARTADILFQTSDTTWQAYNLYGGNSLYCNGPFSNAAGRYSCPTRSAKVSYNRPFDTRAHDATSFLFNAEYPMVRWLEANGYDVKYWTGVDTDRFGADPSIGLGSLRRPKAFFSVGHDEYWSAAQRTHVENARNAGVNLAFFSGNEMFWKTRYEPSIDGSNTSFRTLVSYKETFGSGARVDPNPANPWTGTWRDPRFPAVGGGNPENGLIGQLWMVNCCSDRIHVPPSMANLRFWRNTAVAELPPGDPGYRTPVETLGYEWDEVIDNGRLPAGLVRMSTTTLIVPERVLDFGINIGVGTATHSLTMYRHNSGALVFGAGTVQWAWGLDDNHDRTVVPTDHAMQQATVNLLADMGAQPRTLQVGANPARPLVSATMSNDIFAPTSTIVSPAAGSSVESGSRVVISGTAVENGGGTLGGVEVSVDDGATWRTANLLPSGVWNYEWTPGSPGAATIRSRAFDDSGNIESAGAGNTVTITAGTCPCTSLWRPITVPTVPSAADTNAVELGTKFYSDTSGFITGVRFYKSTANTGTHIGNLWSLSGTRLATVVFSNETPSGWQQALFSTPVAITASTTYVVSYHTNVGSYAADAGYFATAPIDSPPLHAPSSPVAGGNGVFAYGESQFPTGTFNGTNYWVDVVFAASIADSTPPVISRVKATIVDSSRVTISWSTDEASTSRVQYSTDPEILSNTTTLPPGTQTVNVGTFVTQHSVMLSGLTPNTTYYYRVISVDRSGNTADVAAPSVTVPGPTLRDTATPDFGAGTNAGTYVSETLDGEVILQPAVGSEFSGSTLSSGWSSVPYASGGASFVGDGVVLVDGSRLGTCVDVNGFCQEQWSLTPGHRLEFTAIFTGDAFQHSGLAQDFSTASQPWAIFSTMSGGALTARSNTGAGNIDTFLGTGFLGLPHRYTIDWTDTSVVYSVDGTVVAMHTVAVPGPMRPLAASDFSVFGGNVAIDWMRLTPYAASGTFNSRVFDANAIVNWGTIQWTATRPLGTNLEMAVRTGITPNAEDGTWSAWQTVAAPGPLALSSRYIQYRAVMSTSDGRVTPDLADVIVSTGHAPIAVPDGIVVPQNGFVTLPASGPGSLVANDTDADRNVLEVAAVGPATHGVAELNFDGSVKYTPVANYSGPDSFLYTVSDGLLTASALVTIDVRFGNVPPVANNNFYSVDEDSTLLVAAANGVLQNDTDVEHDALTAVLVTPPGHGVLALNASGAFTYAPNPNYAGPDAFAYRAFDGQLNSEPAIVQIDVRQVNDAPVSEVDAYTALLNQPLHVGAPGVLANDHDVEVEDTAPMHAQLVAGPANGTLTFNSDGSFDYVPRADFLGLDQFRYAAVDHLNAVGNTVTVSITVAVKAVSQAVNSGGTVSTGADVTSQDPLASAVTTPAAATIRIAQGVIAESLPPTGYTFLNQQISVAVLNPDGSELTASLASPIRLVFTVDSSLLLPGENQTTFQVFRNGIRIPDCLGQSTIPAANLDPCVTAREGGAVLNGDVRLTILTSHASQWNVGTASSVIGDAPIAQNDGVYQINAQAPLTVGAAGVLGNDYGRNGLKAVLSAGSALNGSVNLADSGAFTFTPAATACGTASFKYRATDGTSSSNEATVSILIVCQARAVNDAATVLEDSGTTTIAVLANDVNSDPSQPLKVTAVTAPAHGVAAVAAGGTGVTYAPAANYFGPDSFAYTMIDSHGATATATVSITVTPVNDAPSFVKGADQRLLETAGPQSVPNWATEMSAGPANEAAQVLSFVVTNDNNALFSVQPAIAANGTLTYALAANVRGINHVAHVSVRLRDNAGTANGGVDTSGAQVFVISVIPGIYISDVMLAEGDSDDAPFTFMVTLAGASDLPVSVSFATADSTATAPEEYTAAAGVLTFAPGVVSLPISIGVTGDTRDEPDETFSVNLFNAVNGTIRKAQGAGIIQNDDATPGLTIGNATVAEGNSGATNMTFTVTLSPQSGIPVTVNFATANGSALAPSDYTAQSGTLTFEPGVVTQTITVQAIGNTIDTPNKTFTVNLSGAVNAEIVDAQGIGTIVDDDTSLVSYSTVADFGTGTMDAGAYLSETANGEVMLKPTLATEFSGSTLPSGWLSTVLITKGTVTVSDGSVKLQGTQIMSTTPLIAPGRSVEFSATFSGCEQQLTGLLLAHFTTKLNGTTVGLYARSTNGLKRIETLIPGNWFGAPHRFRIDWNTAGAVYWIDGAKVATHSLTFSSLIKMTVIASDLFKSNGVLTIDWVRTTPYAAAGTYTSNVVDAGAPVNWLTMSWSADKPAGTNIVASYRTGNSPTPDATWTPFVTVPASGAPLTGASRFIQYRLQESTTNVGQTPAVEDVVIAFNR